VGGADDGGAHAAGLPVIYHACGNVKAIFDDYIDLRIDAYNPLEAKGRLGRGNCAAKSGEAAWNLGPCAARCRRILALRVILPSPVPIMRPATPAAWTRDRWIKSRCRCSGSVRTPPLGWRSPFDHWYVLVVDGR